MKEGASHVGVGGGGSRWGKNLWLQVQAWCPSDEGLRHRSPGGGFYAKLDVEQEGDTI